MCEIEPIFRPQTPLHADKSMRFRVPSQFYAADVGCWSFRRPVISLPRPSDSFHGPRGTAWLAVPAIHACARTRVRECVSACVRVRSRRRASLA